MKIGIKLGNRFDKDKGILEYFENKVDFFEISAIQEKNYYSLLENSSLPIIIHAEHHDFGINYADNSIYNKNLRSLNFARGIADTLKSDRIIVHPGGIEQGNPNCSKENLINFFKNIEDNRILLENLPGKEKDQNLFTLCVTPDEIKYVMESTKKGFCFDVNHAIFVLTQNNNLNYDIIKDYISLNPRHYHIGGQKIQEPFTHQSLEDSELDLSKILINYPIDAEISLETRHGDFETKDKDIQIIKKVIKILEERI